MGLSWLKASIGAVLKAERAAGFEVLPPAERCLKGADPARGQGDGDAVGAWVTKNKLRRAGHFATRLPAIASTPDPVSAVRWRWWRIGGLGGEGQEVRYSCSHDSSADDGMDQAMKRPPPMRKFDAGTAITWWSYAPFRQMDRKPISL